LICVVSHDAGGAEILASYVSQNGLQCEFALDGPALRVFERRLGPIALSALEDAVGRCDWVLCGTSWQSDLEWQAFGAARRHGKKAVAFLDHWGNYRERFVRRGEQRLPDELWVGDALAESYARECFPGASITLVPNPFFADLRRDIAAAEAARGPRQGTGLRVLFVSEPLREHGLREFGNELHWGYTEEDALRYLVSHLAVLGGDVERVTVRPHPSEPRNKYDWVSAELGAHVVAGGSRTLLEEVADSDVVAGCESMAMVVALVAGRRVVCCIPPGGKPSTLPHAEIESLQALVASPPSRPA
jgi:hypothetical protein